MYMLRCFSLQIDFQMKEGSVRETVRNLEAETAAAEVDTAFSRRKCRKRFLLAPSLTLFHGVPFRNDHAHILAARNRVVDLYSHINPHVFASFADHYSFGEFNPERTCFFRGFELSGAAKKGAPFSLGYQHPRSEERRVGKECRSR